MSPFTRQTRAKHSCSTTIVKPTTRWLTVFMIEIIFLHHDCTTITHKLIIYFRLLFPHVSELRSAKHRLRRRLRPHVAGETARVAPHQYQSGSPNKDSRPRWPRTNVFFLGCGLDHYIRRCNFRCRYIISDIIWYDLIWHDIIWYNLIWYDMIWYEIIYIYIYIYT